MKKRVFALLLCLLLCLSILPVGAFADDYCEHDIVKMEAKATCGEAHREHYKCTKCGKLFSDERGEHEISYESVAQEKLPHTSELKHVEFKDASCTESGNYEYWVCTECGQMFSENPGFEDETDNRRTKPVPDDKVKDYTIEPYGHNLVFHEAVPHTCTQDGNVAYYQCSNCWWSFSDPEGLNPLSSVTDPAAHVKTEYPAVAPTCDTDGSSYYFYCSVCGKYYNEYGQEIEEGSWVIPAGHDYVEHPFQEPTCTAGGNRLYYTCSGCDKVFDADLNETTLEAVTLNMIPHSLVIHVPAVAKSCYTDGNVEYWQCASCGAKFADAEGTLPLTDEEVVIPACHEFVATPAKEPTCTEPGNIAYWTCTVEGCGIVVDESGNQVWETAVPAAGHKPVKVERTTTCTEAGTAEHYKCEVCGRLFQDEACTVEKTLEDLQEAAPGHDYDADGVCTRCGAISPDTPAFDGTSYVDVPTPQGTWQRVIVRVTAQKGVFPAGSQLSAQVVLNADAEIAKEAVDAAREEGATPSGTTYTFDIKILNRYGFEVQPADDSKVNVSFALAEAKKDNLDATIYHLKEEEDGSKSAEALNTSVQGEGEDATIVAETDGFSQYAVDFTFREYKYQMPGNGSAKLTDIMSTLRLGSEGTVRNVSFDKQGYLSAAQDGSGEWIVTSTGSFSEELSMTITMTDSTTYLIKVTDPVPEVTITITSGTAQAGSKGPAPQIVITLSVDSHDITITANTAPSGKTFEKWTSITGIAASALDDVNAPTAHFTIPDTQESANIGITAGYSNKVVFVKNTSVAVTNMPADRFVPDGTVIKSTDLSTPSADGYEFAGWYEDAEGKTPVTFPLTINSNKTLYAKWQCRVTFNTLHGTTPTAQIVDINAKATQPADMKWIGYTWGGWYTDKAWTNAFNFNTAITRNMVLYARWIPDLKITKGDGGTAHYGSTYAFTLNYYYPDYNKNSSEFEVYIGRHNSSTTPSKISRSHYVVTQGADKRAVVTLKASYIRTLTDGATYDIWFDTGLGPYEYDAKEYPPIDLGATDGTFKVSKSPKTGDESNVALWAAIAGVSLIVVIVIAVVLLNKRKKGKKAPTPPENRPADKTKKPPKE